MADIDIQFTWQTRPDALANEIDAWWTEARSRIAEGIRAVGAQAIVYARSAHPWTNRTGQAEAGLSYQVDADGDTVRLIVYHQAPHGRWLETRADWGGRWGVLPKTMRSAYGATMSAVRAALGG